MQLWILDFFLLCLIRYASDTLGTIGDNVLSAKFHKKKDFTIIVTLEKTRLYNTEPLKPHFYIVKLEFTRVYIIFLIYAQNIDCGYSLEPPQRGVSNEYHNLCFEQNYEKCLRFLSENFQFLEVKFSIYLNRHVFEMKSFFMKLCAE